MTPWGAKNAPQGVSPDLSFCPWGQSVEFNLQVLFELTPFLEVLAFGLGEEAVAPSPEGKLRLDYFAVVTFKVGDHGKGPSPSLKLLKASTR
jgi:hypothetical protein